MKTLSILFTSFMSTLLFIGSGCSNKFAALQPDKQPYKFEKVSSLPGDELVLTDLDGNGFTEIISIDFSLPPGQPASFILLMTFEGKTIEQVNFAGRILDSVYPLDYNDDGIKEILVPFVRNDSLFMSFVNARGEKLFYFFLIDGQPRIEDAGTFLWDPQVRGLYIQDLDHNGVKELITVISTGYARLPRGILIHSLPSGKLIGKAITGSPPRENFLDDFDGDGQMEILYLGKAPNNGANAGGFDDKHSYLIRFKLTPVPIVINSMQISDKFCNYALFYEDLNGDAKKELIACTDSESERVPDFKIVELDPVTFRERKIQPLNKLIVGVITNINREPQPEIIALRSQNEIVIMDYNFEEQKHCVFPSNLDNLKTLTDVDNDGIDEIVVLANEGEFLLDPKLKIKACLPDMQSWGIVRRGENLPPQIVVKVKNHFELGILSKNQFYWIKRYYSSAIYIFALGIFLVITIVTCRLRCRNQLLNGVQSLVMDSDSRGLLLFDNRQQILFINQALRNWLGIGADEQHRHSYLKDVFSGSPDLLSCLQDIPNRSLQRYEKSITLQQNHHRHNVQLIIEPAQVKKKKTFWLVIGNDKSFDEEMMQAKTWCRMAQKTAHDIKNPLTTIRLKLEHLQMRHRERFPQASAEFDPFFARILERIELLRRISKNFMKFVNIDKLNFVSMDLNRFLNEATDIIRSGLPPDIQLQFQSGANLPLVKIDQDAMRSVIENLVSNAVNVMPEGGKITISTQLVPGLTFPGKDQCAKDYVLIEVLDTGTGINPTDCEHLFEPDFTRTECGNGLGLAYVKKTVDDHGGYIEVESEPGAGTAFCIYIPTI